MKKRVLLFLMIFVFLIFGCSKNKSVVSPEPEKIKITMYLWDKKLTKELTPWLEAKFPDYDINFIVGFNNMDYYKDIAERTGEVPDIITCRRFSLNDAYVLSDKLVDFASSEISSSFYPSYLDYYRESDGSVRWLPMCAVVDGFVANLDLFEEYGIEIPTDYSSFIASIDKFESMGIRGFATDYIFDYTCLEILQGTSVSLLNSLEGTMWRREYESGNYENAKALEKSIWPVVFSNCYKFIQDTHARAEDNTNDFQYYVKEFTEGRVAVIRATSHDAAVIKNTYGINTAMLPYYCENENWVLTYPMFQVAVSKEVENNSEKKNAVMDILDAMFSTEGQIKAAAGSSFLSYNKTVSIPLTEEMKYISPLIDANHLYMRLASTEMFSYSKRIVQKMVNGEIDDKEAYKEFSSLLEEGEIGGDKTILFTQDKSYSLSFSDNGNEAASAVLNTIRNTVGSDIAISYSSLVSTPVLKGDYSFSELEWIVTYKNPVYTDLYTGQEIWDVMAWLINTDVYGNNPLRHKNFMPVTSGMEYEMRDNGDGTYTLISLTINGDDIQKDKTYSLSLTGYDTYITSWEYCNCPMPQWLEEKRGEDTSLKTNKEYLVEGVMEEGRILPPSRYVTIVDKNYEGE